MKYLIYCLFRCHRHHELAPLTGVGAQPVFLIANNGLCAAASLVAQADLVPSIPRVHAYQKVVESLHSDHTVIPMRYGCVCDEEVCVVDLLEKGCRQYERLLEELQNCAEMGIRILMSHAECRPLSSAGPNLRFQHSGRAYLAARRARYLQEELLSKEMITTAQSCRAAFRGLFTRSKMESSSIYNSQSTSCNLSVFSLQFLVPRRSLEAFRRVFRQLSNEESAKLLLSGPWPPYSFVELGDVRD